MFSHVGVGKESVGVKLLMICLVHWGLIRQSG